MPQPCREAWWNDLPGEEIGERAQILLHLMLSSRRDQVERHKGQGKGKNSEQTELGQIDTGQRGWFHREFTAAHGMGRS